MKKAKERMQDIDDTITFLQAGGPSAPAPAAPRASGAAAPAAAAAAAHAGRVAAPRRRQRPARRRLRRGLAAEGRVAATPLSSPEP